MPTFLASVIVLGVSSMSQDGLPDGGSVRFMIRQKSEPTIDTG